MSGSPIFSGTGITLDDLVITGCSLILSPHFFARIMIMF